MPRKRAVELEVGQKTRFDLDEFREQFLLRGRPVVYEGAARRWPAVKKWSPAYFSKHFGAVQLPIQAVDGRARTDGAWSKISIKKYVDLLMNPGQQKPPPYLRNILMPRDLPALIADVRRPRMAQQSWLEHPALRELVPPLWHNWYELFVNAPKVRFPWVHADRDHTHAWVAQIYGHKKVWLWPPGVAGPRTRQFYVSPRKDIDRFFNGFAAQSLILAPGDLVFVPRNWWHTTEAQSVSISVSGNWVGEDNWADFIGSYFAGALGSGDPEAASAIATLDAAIRNHFRRR